MAGAAQRPAAEEHSVGLFRPMDLGWHAGAHPSRALCGGTRAGGTGGEPDHGNHRQPERQGRAKRGALLDPQGFDAGKKITGRKRHILVDTLGLLLSVAVHPANIQDRDGVALVLDRRTRRLFPFIERIYGDGGYQGPKAAKAAAKTGCWTIEIVERSPTAVGFEVLPKRWIVERTFAWLSRVPPPSTRLRALRQNRCRVHPPRHDPHHAEATRCKLLVMNRNFADGLLTTRILKKIGVFNN